MGGCRRGAKKRKQNGLAPEIKKIIRTGRKGRKFSILRNMRPKFKGEVILEIRFKGFQMQNPSKACEIFSLACVAVGSRNIAPKNKLLLINSVFKGKKVGKYRPFVP